MNQNLTSSTNLRAARQPGLLADEPTTTSSSGGGGDREKLTRRIFRTLEASIGTRLAQLWEGTNREAVADRWTAGLLEFTAEDFAAACKAFDDSGDDWPPGLPRFKAMCNVAKHQREAEIARHRQGQLKLESHNSAEQQAQVEAATANLRDHQQRQAGAAKTHWAETAVRMHEEGTKRLTPDALKIAREALARVRSWEKPADPGPEAAASETQQVSP